MRNSNCAVASGLPAIHGHLVRRGPTQEFLGEAVIGRSQSGPARPVRIRTDMHFLPVEDGRGSPLQAILRCRIQEIRQDGPCAKWEADELSPGHGLCLTERTAFC